MVTWQNVWGGVKKYWKPVVFGTLGVYLGWQAKSIATERTILQHERDAAKQETKVVSLEHAIEGLASDKRTASGCEFYVVNLKPELPYCAVATKTAKGKPSGNAYRLMIEQGQIKSFVNIKDTTAPMPEGL